MKVFLECLDTGDLLLETDFILNYLFKDFEYQLVGTTTLKSGGFTSAHDTNNCVLIFTSNLNTFEQILKVIQEIKPRIVVQLSDEHQNDNNFEFTNLGKYCELYLRQYNHSNFEYTANTFFIPLGFTNFGFEKTTKGLKSPYWEYVHKSIKKPSLERKYIWSFIGTVKGDRAEMLERFSKLNGISKYTQTVEEVIDTYSESIFVPCGRGNSSLDCFRLYEASACGAIPIVVGTYNEYSNTFRYENSPPWIFADTWEEATKYVSFLLDNPEKINILQEKLIQWWGVRLESVNTKIKSVL